MEKDELVQKVTKALEKYLPREEGCKFKIHIDEDGIRSVDEWWHVPVWPEPVNVPKTYQYYEVLAEAEADLQDDAETVKVVLIPTFPHTSIEDESA